MPSAKASPDPIGRQIDWCVCLLVAVWATDLIVLPFAPFAVAWLSFWPVAAWLLLMGGIAAVYTVWRPEPAIVTAAVATTELLLFTLGTAILNYLGFMVHRPLFDAVLAGVDERLGFSWPQLAAGLARIPYADNVLLLAYNSSLLQVAGVVLFLALSGRIARARTFTLGFMLSGLTAVWVWIAFPTVGTYIYYYSLGMPVPHAGSAIDPAYAQAVIGMFNGVFAPFRYNNILGLVGFPSFHTSIAILCAWAVYDVRKVGPLVVAANVLVILSVPVQGGHHLVDVLGGAAVAAAAIWLATRLAAAPDEAAAVRVVRA